MLLIGIDLIEGLQSLDGVLVSTSIALSIPVGSSNQRHSVESLNQGDTIFHVVMCIIPFFLWDLCHELGEESFKNFVARKVGKDSRVFGMIPQIIDSHQVLQRAITS
jgi:hypothetical protein